MTIKRRQFLKISSLGATGLILGGRASSAFGAWPSSGTLAINPNISNMRVVGCVDPTMMKSKPTSMTFSAENAVVDSARVSANLDAMAMQLAKASTADAAWSTIFRSGRAWASTLVAIKVNTLEPKNMARVAVLQKLVSVLRKLGVQPANIIVFDGNDAFSGGISNYKSHFDPGDSTKIQAVLSNLNSALGGTTSATLPDRSSAECTANIASGKVDILINIANNKGHALFAGSTLCMKNHFGTFAPNHKDLANYVFKINKSDAIIGGSPPRQQLCLVDSLFANKASNSGTPEVMPGYLVMGTFAPAVDFLTVKKVREGVMGCKHDSAIVNSFMTSFGYTVNDPEWVLVPPASDSVIEGGSDGPAEKDGGSEAPVHDAGAAAPVRDAGRAEAPGRDAGAGAVEDPRKGGSIDSSASGGGSDLDGANDGASGSGCSTLAGGGDLGPAILVGGALVAAKVGRLLGKRENPAGSSPARGEEEETHEPC